MGEDVSGGETDCADADGLDGSFVIRDVGKGVSLSTVCSASKSIYTSRIGFISSTCSDVKAQRLLHMWSTSRTLVQRRASSTPSSTRTRKSTGRGIASMIKRKMNPSRMFPVRSAMMPTTAGPMKDEDLSVREKREKKLDSWPW